jgi:hypothetical protein
MFVILAATTVVGIGVTTVVANPAPSPGIARSGPARASARSDLAPAIASGPAVVRIARGGEEHVYL